MVDGNERLALGATIAFLGLNGFTLTLSDDEAYDLVMSVAAGDLTEVVDIGKAIGAAIQPR